MTISPFQDALHRGQVIALWEMVFGYETAHNRPGLVIDKKLAHKDDLFFVAADESGVIGTVMAGYDGHRGWIYSVAVSPTRRREGIGSRLIAHAERALIEKGCVKINLQVLDGNAAAVQFYEALGYAVEKRVSMGKRIAQNAPQAAPVKLRPFQPSDLEQVICVYRSAIHTLAAPFYTPDQLSAWAPAYMDPEKWRQRLASVRGIVADAEGVIAGFLTYDLTGHIDMLFVLPNFARRGIATRLYLDAETELRKLSAPQAFAEVSLAARPFFERHGFKVDFEEFVECRGQQLHRFRMSKPIL